MIHAGLRDTATLFAARRSPVAALGATAAAVIVIDQISKALALYVLRDLDAAQTRFLQLGVHHNIDLAWGLSAGAEGAAISGVAALVIVGISLTVCSALTSHDRMAPVMLGLIGGAGVANATDALTPPVGVVDWIAVGAHGGIVVNLADLAVLIGVCLCARTVYRLTLAIRQQHAARR
jgi:lipoprotein signal peptidase